MRHRKKRHHLSKASDQRNAMMRALVTNLLKHEQITTTLTRAKALVPLSDKMITLAKQGDLHAIRQIAKVVYNADTGETMADDKNNGREIKKTVLRKLVREVAPRFEGRQGGYTRIIPAPPRRGDATKMAVVELVD